MRVISGSLKGRSIKGFDIEGTRPTMDRVKESVFGSIQSYIPNSLVLDLFAGSGALGIEAISNGARECYFVDKNKKCVRCISDNLDDFNVRDRGRVINKDYRDALKEFRDKRVKFDVIFIDPPYNYENINSVVSIIDKYDLINSNGVLVLEFRYDNLVLDDSLYTLRKAKRYGDKYVYVYIRK